MSAMEIHIYAMLFINTNIISHKYKFQFMAMLLPAVVVKMYGKNIDQIYNKT